MSNIKKYKAEKNKKCICGDVAIEKLVFYGGVTARQRNIYLCEECRKRLIDIVVPF